MARSFPADVKLQNFYTEQFHKENATRLRWVTDLKRGVAQSAPRRVRGSNVPDGLPTIHPMVYARDKKLEEQREMENLREIARSKQSMEEMFEAPRQEREQLFDGFTKEGRGRYLYLKNRHEVIPEDKFSFPLLSSWDYGWKLNDSSVPTRPRHARTRKIADTFYTRNRVPTLGDPTLGVKFEKCKTSINF